MSSVHSTPEKLENARITLQFGFVFEKKENLGKEITEMNIEKSSSSKSSVDKFVLVHTETKRRRFHFPDVFVTG